MLTSLWALGLVARVAEAVLAIIGAIVVYVAAEEYLIRKREDWRPLP